MRAEAEAEVKVLMSGEIAVSCPPLAEAPEETTRLPLGQDTVPITVDAEESLQKYWVTYWMVLEAGTSADAGAANVASPATVVPAANAVATARCKILMTLLH